jgi:RHS repeat-associated protein
MGRQKSVTNPYRSTGDSTYGVTVTGYDALSRVKRVETSDGSGVSTGAVTTDYLDDQTTVTDQAGKQRRSITDGLGRLIRMDEPDSTGLGTVAAPTQPTSYFYDVLDDLAKVTQGGQSRYFMYDSLKRLIRARNPEQDTNASIALSDPLTGNSQWSMKYTYDENSNLSTKIDARGATGITTTYTYDALNRVTNRIYTNDPQNTPAVNYKYDTQPLPTGFPAGFDRGYSTGRLVAVTYGETSAGSYTGYDQLGRVMSSYQQTDSQNYGFGYVYNRASEMTSQTYPSGRVVQTEYDTTGRIAGMKNQASGLYYAGGAASDGLNRIQYAASGAVSAMKLGNGKWEHTNYNNRLQPTQIGLGTSTADSSTLKLDYTYGSTTNNGNVQTQTLTIGATVMSQSYGYDALNRLQGASENSGSSWSQTYGYDRYGNRWVSASTGYTLSSLTPQSLGAFNTATNKPFASQYDGAGNQTGDAQSRQFTYDAENRQLTFNSTVGQYFYDGDGHRVKRIDPTGTTVFVYNAGGQLIAEYHSDPVPPVAGGGGTSYLTSDHLGSTRVVTDAQGNVKARHDYLPFGEELGAGIGQRTTTMKYDAPDSTKQKFTQKERDNESGLDYFLARYYSSAQGRFTSPDPLGPWAMSEEEKAAFLTTPQKWNRYAYVTNNPLRYSDPDGLEQYDRSVNKEEQERIHQALIDISANGNAQQQARANYILATDVTIRLAQGMPNGGATDINSNAANSGIANGSVSETQAGSFIRITLNKSSADDTSGKGNAMLEGVLVHEGKHVVDDARTISSLSEKGRVFDPTEYSEEHSAFVSEATFFRDRGGPFTKVGLKPRSYELLVKDDSGNIRINEKHIREVLRDTYRVTPNKQGPTTTQKFGLRRPR